MWFFLPQYVRHSHFIVVVAVAAAAASFSLSIAPRQQQQHHSSNSTTATPRQQQHNSNSNLHVCIYLSTRWPSFSYQYQRTWRHTLELILLWLVCLIFLLVFVPRRPSFPRFLICSSVYGEPRRRRRRWVPQPIHIFPLSIIVRRSFDIRHYAACGSGPSAFADK